MSYKNILKNRVIKNVIKDLLKKKQLINSMKSSSILRGLNTYQHNLNVCGKAFRLTEVLNADKRIVTRAAFLHDCWVEEFRSNPFSGIFHYRESVKIAKKLKEDKRIIYAIQTHMFPYGKLPLSREAMVVWLADKFCAIEEIIKYFSIKCLKRK
jgi:putative nucleotidyltransferase with HDIG domain